MHTNTHMQKHTRCKRESPLQEAMAEQDDAACLGMGAHNILKRRQQALKRELVLARDKRRRAVVVRMDCAGIVSCKALLLLHVH